MFEWQVEATRAFYAGIRRDVRFFVWVVSRQLGKTALLEAITTRQASLGSTCGYFAPSYDRSEEVYTETCEALRHLIDKNYVTNKQTKAGWVIRYDRELVRAFGQAAGVRNWRRLRGGACHYKSLGNPEHLRGQTLDGAVCDETGLIPGRVYRKIIRPMLTAKDGWTIFSGTPPEDDETPDPMFFRGLEEYAKESGDRAWWYIHRDYRAHPSERVVEAIERERLRMPHQEFAREYLATFPNIEEYRLPPLRTWGPRSRHETKSAPALLPDGLRICTGVDLADNDRQIGDKAAVVTYAVASNGVVYVLAAEYYRNPSEVLDALYLHRGLFGTTKIAIQDSTFDKGFRHTVQAAEPTRGPLPIVVTKIGGASKRRRILALEPIARRGGIYVHEDLADFMNEWAQFPDNLDAGAKRRIKNRMTHHYDMLDAGAVMAEDIMMCATWSPPEATGMNTMRSALRALKAKRRGMNAERHFRL